MLDEVGKSIDGVTVSTPDHTHAPAAALAIRMGKHVYCQKPLTHSIYEARTLAELTRKHNVMTQMGNQGTALEGLHLAAQVVKEGHLGTVKEVHVWTNRPIWRQGIDFYRPTSTRKRRVSTGTASSGRRRCVLFIQAISVSVGAATGILAPAPWVIWRATR